MRLAHQTIGQDDCYRARDVYSMQRRVEFDLAKGGREQGLLLFQAWWLYHLFHDSLWGRSGFDTKDLQISYFSFFWLYIKVLLGPK